MAEHSTENDASRPMLTALDWMLRQYQQAWHNSRSLLAEVNMLRAVLEAAPEAWGGDVVAWLNEYEEWWAGQRQAAITAVEEEQCQNA